MLHPIPRLVMIPQEVPWAVRIRSHPRYRIELMIAENAPSRTGLHHLPHQANGLELLRSAVDQIADKYSSTLGVTPNAGRLGITEHAQEGSKLVEFTVDIAYDVKTHISAVILLAWMAYRLANEPGR
jgi:hypothetical protein